MQTIKNLLSLVLEKPTAALRVISTDENSALEEPFRSLSPDVGVSLENSASVAGVCNGSVVLCIFFFSVFFFSLIFLVDLPSMHVGDFYLPKA